MALFDHESVLEFWFGDAVRNPAELETMRKRWFSSDPEFDRRINNNFGHFLNDRTVNGDIQAYLNPRARLATIIILDQFPRNVFRGDARAYAYDSVALANAERGLAAGEDKALALVERTFFYLPFEHAEDVAAQVKCVELFRALVAEADGTCEDYFRTNLDYAVQHLEIIEQFNRFPHRNQVLGRESTPEEIAYLSGSGSSFGQG